MAKTINAANIAIGYDGSKLKAGTDMARADLAKLKSILKDTADPAKMLAYEEGLLKKALDAGAISAETAARSMRKLKDDYAKATGAAREHTTAANSTGESLKRLAGLAAGVLSLRAAYSQLADSVKLAAQVEKSTAVFSAITGSGVQGRQLIADMKELTKQGIAFSTSSQIAQTMLSFGMAAEEVIPSLQKIAMITAADAERMKMLGLAFSQSAAAGRLMGQDLLQMVNAGFNPLQEVSRVTGIELLDLKKKMEEAQISTDLVKLAFDSATGAAGRFKDVMEAQKGTIAGQYNRFLADIEKLKTGIGQDLLPLMQDLVKLARELTDAGGGKSKFKEFVFGLRQELAFIDDVLHSLNNGLIVSAENTNRLINSEADRVKAEYEAFEKERQRNKKQKLEDEEMKKKMVDALEVSKKADPFRGLGMAVLQQEEEKFLNQLKEEEKVRERMKESAKQLLEAQMTPLEKLKESLREIIALQNAGMLTAEQARRAGLDAAGKLKTQKSNPLATTAIAGTQEAYRLLVGEVENQDKQAEAQRILAQAQLEVQKEIAKNTKEPQVEVIR